MKHNFDHYKKVYLTFIFEFLLMSDRNTKKSPANDSVARLNESDSNPLFKIDPLPKFKISKERLI